MRSAVNNFPEDKDYVLDSYALLAYLEADRGSWQVQKLLEGAREAKFHLFMCVVNLGEVIYIVERERGLTKAQETLARINELPIEIINADRVLTLAAAHLKTDCPIAYADCFAAALSQIKHATLVTGDPEFRKIKAQCKVPIAWLNEPG